MNVTHSADDDYIAALITAATAWTEEYLQRKLITQEWYLYIDDWASDEIIMPFGDLQSVASVKYYDTDDTEATFSDTKYTVDTASVPGRIKLKYEEEWPDTDLRPDNPIIIEFTTGYGDAGTDIYDNGIIHALKIMVAHWYENRELVHVTVNSNTVTEMPTSAKALLYPYRVWEWLL